MFKNIFDRILMFSIGKAIIGYEIDLLQFKCWQILDLIDSRNKDSNEPDFKFFNGQFHGCLQCKSLSSVSLIADNC